MNLSSFEIGSQLFINAHDTSEQIRAWVRQMKESKLSVIRLFIHWDRIEPEKGRWDFHQYDACFDEAELQGMRIIPTIISGAPPRWVGRIEGIDDRSDFHNPMVWEFALNYVSELVLRYHESSALHSWILWNEPGYTPRKSSYGIDSYARFLKEKYRRLEEINHIYRDNYQSFAEVADDSFDTNQAYGFYPYPQRLDWLWFCVHTLMEKLRDIQSVIKEIDPVHPTHVNPHNISQCILDSGQSIWNEAELTDFIGCSAHPSWHSVRFPNDRLHQSVAMFADLMKSATRHPDGLFWVTELQGGTNIFSGVNYLCPSGNAIRHWMWEGIGSGARGIVFWCFNTRDSAFEAGEWGLLNQAGKPSERLLAATEVIKVIDANKELFEKAVPPKPDVWILHSENTAAMALIEGSGSENPTNPRNPQYASDALCGAYLMCSDIGLSVQFVNEDRFVSEGLQDGSVLLLPSTTSLKEETCQTLEKHVTEKGCTIIGDGLCGYKDEYGFIKPKRNEWSKRLFGAYLEDIQAIDGMSNESIQIKLENLAVSLEPWFIRCLFNEEPGVRIVGRYNEKIPAILEYPNGNGKSIRIGTVFFQRYFCEPGVKSLEILRNLLPERLNDNISLANQSSSLRLKILQSGVDQIIILLNTAGKQTARLHFPKKTSLKGLNCEYALQANSGADEEIDIEVEGVMVFKATFEA